MKSNNQITTIVVFDIDHTLINGNLTKILIKSLLKKKPWWFFAFLPLITYDFFLKKIQVPLLIKKYLKKNNQTALDTAIQKKFTALYKKIFGLLHWLYTDSHILKTVATKKLTPTFLTPLLFKRGVTALKNHLENKETLVVLASGELEEIVTAFTAALAKRIKYNLDDGRLLATGTAHSKKTFELCIGSQKLQRVLTLLKTNGFSNASIDTVYSDNDLFKDLPLIMAAQQHRIIINTQDPLYKLLPQAVVQSFTFLPQWHKK